MTDDLQARRVEAALDVWLKMGGYPLEMRMRKSLAAADAVTAEADQPQKPPRKAREAR